MRAPFLCTSVAALFLASACGSPSGPVPAATSSGKHVDPATAGAVSGRVTFEGTPPVREPLKMAADPACAESSGPKPLNDAVLIKDGGIQNVFVYVKDGLDSSYAFDVPKEPVRFDQRGCRYIPRIFGVRAGQPIEIINDDNTMHNVHAIPQTNAEFNQSMPVQGQRITKTFTSPEVMVRVKCNVHNWMTAYAGVMAHPFFAVTNETGSFEIKGLPPGTYTIEAWHERFGTKTQKITIADRQTQTLPFTFAAAKGQP